MEAALQISFYVLGVVLLLGVLMVLVLIKDVFFHGRFNTLLPSVRRVPSTALDAAHATLKRLQMAHAAAHGERRDSLAYEIKHLEHRISALEDKTYADQADYYAAAKARERTWREWRAFHADLQHAHRRQRRDARNRLDELRQDYQKLDREVDEEYQRAVARDVLTLEELRTQGVLEPEILKPPPPAAAAQAAPPAAADAAADAADAADAAAPAPDAAQAAPAPATPGRSGRWMTPLTPYPPAQGGLLGQADMALPDLRKTERTYVDPTFSMAPLPGGALTGADLSRSSLAEVELAGVHRYVNCTFVATDLRRIELRAAETPHVFQDCDLRGASLAQAHLAGAVFRRCNLAGTHWRSARLDRVKFESCRLDNAHWEGVDLSRTVMSEDMLEHADFAFAAKPPLNLRPHMDSPPELSGGTAPAAPPIASPAGQVPGAAPAPGAPTGPGAALPSQAPAAPAGGTDPSSAAPVVPSAPPSGSSPAAPASTGVPGASPAPAAPGAATQPAPAAQGRSRPAAPEPAPPPGTREPSRER